MASIMGSMRRFFAHRFRRPTLVVAACLALLVGIGLSRSLRVEWLWVAALVLPFAVLSWRRRSWLTLGLLVLCCLGIGAWRGTDYAHKLQTYDDLFQQKVVLTGVAQEDGTYGKRQQLTFAVRDIEVHEPYRTELIGKISVAGFGAPAVFRGDTVQVTGKLFPALGSNQARMSFAQLKVLQHHDSWVETARRNFAAGMQSALPEPVASFGLGLLIGQRSTLPEDVAKHLMVVGLVHIIAVSGYNLTIMLQVAKRLVGKRSKFQATVLFVALIGTFLLFTGSSPSIVRASIVSLLSISAWYFGREIKPLALILLAAAITGLASPLYVWSDVGWYLSFLAFGGVLILAPLLIKHFFKKRQPGLIRTIMIESFCAELMTLPYILYIFGQLSLVALLANVLVVALVPLGMLLALAAGLAGMLEPTVAGWFAWPAKYLLTYMLDIAHLLSRIPHALVEHISFPLGQMLLVYGMVLFVGLIWWRNTRQKRGIITDEAGKIEGG